MLRRSVWLLGIVLTLCGMASAVDDVAVIYNSTAALPAGVTLGNWGFYPRPAGEEPFKPIRLSRTSHALKVVSLGRYQGLRIDLATPIDSSTFQQKNTYLELYLRATEEKKAATEGAAGGETYTAPATGAPVPTPTLPVGGEGTPDPEAGVVLPEEMLPPKPTPVTVPMPAMKNLRFTFITEKGPALLVVTPEQLRAQDEGRWLKCEIPMTLLHPALPLGTKLSRILITSDEPMELLLGRMAVVRDNAPLTLNTFIFPPFLEAGQRIFFAARVQGGLTQYETQWDFDVKAGDSVDATGDRVTHIYDMEGTYMVKCTVRDKTGGKEPVSATMEFKVSRPRE